MEKLSEDFEGLIKDFGVPEQAQPLTKERSVELRRHLPHSIVDFWSVYGIGGTIADGLFQFCDPKEYRAILSLLFKDDKDFSHEDCHVFGYTAFGVLFVWSERHAICEIDLRNLTMSANEFGIEIKNPDLTIGIALEIIDDDSYDLEDDNDGKPLFKRAVKKLGKLQSGEIYGFKLASIFGGAETLEKVEKYPALEHFAILAQADDLKFVDYSNFETKLIRTIG